MKTLKRLTLAMLALLPLATGTALGDTGHGYSRMFVFGASFIDPGNHFAVTGETAHPPFEPIDASYGIGGHHFSNGRTWVEVMAQEMELTEWAKPAYRDPAYGNYAFGYARASQIEPDPMEPSLYDQVQAWMDNGYCTGTEMNDTLFVMDSGYFDALDVLQGANPETVLGGMTASITENIGILYECGARNLLIAYLPPLELSPIVPDDPLGPSLSAIFNYVFLAPVIESYSVEPFNMNVSTVDFFAYVTMVMEMPAVFGFTNVTDSCVEFGVTRGAFCKNRDEYFWWDPLHPTKKVHALLGEFALGELPVPD
jgi:phospholipase/lecithinase/hemolysin